MFKLVIESSKDVKKIVLEFGDESSSMTEITDMGNFSATVASPIKDHTDLIADRMKSTSEPKTTKKKEKEVPLPDISDRPPMVDEDFSKASF